MDESWNLKFTTATTIPFTNLTRKSYFFSNSYLLYNQLFKNGRPRERRTSRRLRRGKLKRRLFRSIIFSFKIMSVGTTGSMKSICLDIFALSRCIFPTLARTYFIAPLFRCTDFWILFCMYVRTYVYEKNGNFGSHIKNERHTYIHQHKLELKLIFCSLCISL